MSRGRQRQRHGVSKNLAEGIGGVLVGAAAVLLLHGWLRRGRVPLPGAPASVAGPCGSDPERSAVGPPVEPRRPSRTSTQPESGA